MSLPMGASLNGLDSWLLLRGMRTLDLRVQQHNANGLAVARALETHPKMKTVYYPGLESHSQHALAQQQMRGFGGMLSFELDGDFQATDTFMSNLQMIPRAASLGGTHTLVVHPAAMLGAVLTEEEFMARGRYTHAGAHVRGVGECRGYHWRCDGGHKIVANICCETPLRNLSIYRNLYYNTPPFIFTAPPIIFTVPI